MTLLLVTMLASMGLPFLFQLLKRKVSFLAGLPSFGVYIVLCAVVGIIIAMAMSNGNVATAAECGLGVFLLSQGFYSAVLVRFLPGRGAVG